MNEQTQLREYRVWDRTTRWFHWINVLAVLALTATGLGILYWKSFGITIPGRALLKTIHVLIGYVAVINLLWRIVWAFIGSRHSRWSAILPLGSRWVASLKGYVAAVASGGKPAYVGHTPIGRISITLLLVLLVAMSATGLVLAGTDLFYPPFGHLFAQWVAAPGVDPASLGPVAIVKASEPHLLNAEALTAVGHFKELYELTHYYGFYTLLVLIGLHIAGVVVGELRGGGTLVSAMFTGRKILHRVPQDRAEADIEHKVD
ncbi:MAG TPA: cytochrome b/b6 domain-containing protein [Steroidobacteraceae bacterium]|nr:cytochrome b/b6 domain-containing protein [Steroidobacteraceae bacterium]